MKTMSQFNLWDICQTGQLPAPMEGFDPFQRLLVVVVNFNYVIRTFKKKLFNFSFICIDSIDIIITNISSKYSPLRSVPSSDKLCINMLDHYLVAIQSQPLKIFWILFTWYGFLSLVFHIILHYTIYSNIYNFSSLLCPLWLSFVRELFSIVGCRPCTMHSAPGTHTE